MNKADSNNTHDMLIALLAIILVISMSLVLKYANIKIQKSDVNSQLKSENSQLMLENSMLCTELQQNHIHNAICTKYIK